MDQPPNAVRRFLDGLTTGDWDGMRQYFTHDAVHDGSMPSWRVQYKGPDRIVQALHEEWTPKGAWHIRKPKVTRAGDTVVLEVEAVRGSPGERVLCRTASVFELRNGRIAEHRYYCCGEWDEATVRRIEAEAPRIEREEPAPRSG